MQYRGTWFHSCVRKIPWRMDELPTPVFLGFPSFSDGKESICNEWHLGLILWRIPMDIGTWQVTVHRVTKSWTRLSECLQHQHWFARTHFWIILSRNAIAHCPYTQLQYVWLHAWTGWKTLLTIFWILHIQYINCFCISCSCRKKETRASSPFL